ncbi:hypothetical protein C2E23DRAFT_812370, partial [Lenzites betulinus]
DGTRPRTQVRQGRRSGSPSLESHPGRLEELQLGGFTAPSPDGGTSCIPSLEGCSSRPTY